MPADGMAIGGSPQMLGLLELVGPVAGSDVAVLVSGENGVDKELVARYVHAHSPRRGHAFLTINCALMSEAQLESELFGHAGGNGDASGQLVAADGGTLFLDEIGDTSLRLQGMLLRFLQSGEVRPAGSDRGVRVDVRVVAATSRDLPELVAAGQFREDLLYRLQVIHLHVPPLRKRRGDVEPLVRHFVERLRPGVEVTSRAMQVLVRYRWPGNVRELRSVVEQAAWAAAPGESIDVEHLPAAVRIAADSVIPAADRRGTVADELYDALVDAGYSFWDHIYPLFLSRDITRHDIRTLVRLGLAATRGNYRGLLRLFGMPSQDYKRFLNFLAAHQCSVDFREFRGISSLRSARMMRITTANDDRSLARR